MNRFIIVIKADSSALPVRLVYDKILYYSEIHPMTNPQVLVVDIANNEWILEGNLYEFERYFYGG